MIVRLLRIDSMILKDMIWEWLALESERKIRALVGKIVGRVHSLKTP